MHTMWVSFGLSVLHFFFPALNYYTYSISSIRLASRTFIWPACFVPISHRILGKQASRISAVILIFFEAISPSLSTVLMYRNWLADSGNEEHLFIMHQSINQIFVSCANIIWDKIFYLIFCISCRVENIKKQTKVEKW